MRFPRQKYWSGLPFSSPGDLSNPGTEPESTMSPALTVDFLPLSHQGSCFFLCCCLATKPCLTLCDPVHCNMPGFPVLHHLPELAQTYVHWVDDAIQSSYSLSSPSLPAALNLSQHQGLFQWVNSASDGQSIGASASASVFLMNIQGWFPLGLTSLISCCPRDSQESSLAPQFESISSLVLSFLYGPTLTSIHDY